ncbi:MAG TPA: hypothetical protein VFM96_14165 [Gaiellaceae bacterium]|nr:hypothetical protein [Gaiellaceae bacterium]
MERIETIWEQGNGGGGGPRFHYYYFVWNSYHDDVRAEVDRQKAAFAEDLAGDGVFHEPFEAQREQWNDDFRAKRWPPEVLRRIDEDGEPLILVTSDDSGSFQMFDPAGYRWAIIWLSDFEGTPYDIKPMFQTLARKTKHGDDVIDYLRDVAVRRQRKQRAGSIAQMLSRAGSYIDVKPTIPFLGISIDVKAILADIAEAAKR